MFLSELSYQEKIMFLSLSVYAANANNELALEEKELIDSYCREMNISEIDLSEIEPYETVLDYFSLCEDRVKKIVVLEILGLIYIDGKTDEAEQEFISRLLKSLEIQDSVFDEIKKVLSDYLKVCKDIKKVIDSNS